MGWEEFQWVPLLFSPRLMPHGEECSIWEGWLLQYGGMSQHKILPADPSALSPEPLTPDSPHTALVHSILINLLFVCRNYSYRYHTFLFHICYIHILHVLTSVWCYSFFYFVQSKHSVLSLFIFCHARKATPMQLFFKRY